MPWWIYAAGAAVAASATALFTKVGTAGIPSNLAAGTRTFVAMLFIMGLVAVTGEFSQAKDVPARTWTFLVLGGIATGLSWLAYFKAFQMASIVQVAPIDKLSLPLTVLLAALLLGESMSWKAGAGILLMTLGAWVTTLK